MQPFAQVVEPFGSEGVVVVLPGELGLEVGARGEGLAGFDDLVSRTEGGLVGGFFGGRMLGFGEGRWVRTKRFLVSMSGCLGRL